jgi:hypothetical protein
MLPSADRMVFRNTAFFTQKEAPTSLPSPSVIRAAGSSLPVGSKPSTVAFKSTNLMVKYGRAVTTSEGKCLWAIRSQMGDKCPVPEVYGWCCDGDEVFIYMELVRGDTLSSRWDRSVASGEEGNLCSAQTGGRGSAQIQAWARRACYWYVLMSLLA